MKSERTKAGSAGQLNSELSLPIRQPLTDLMRGLRKPQGGLFFAWGLTGAPATIHNADRETVLIDKDGDRLALSHAPYIKEMEKSVTSS